MIYIVINSKGGVGKSTFSNQILSSYLFDKNKQKIKLVEIDDENNDSVTFSKSDIMNCEIISTNNIKNIDEIFFDSEDCIIDIGGNKTATIFLSEMKKINEFESVVWFIPLGSGEQDNLNALETYKDIISMDSNAKVIFVLSRVTSNDLEWEFLNFFGNKYLDTSLSLMNKVDDLDYISINSNSILNNARYFQKTAYDLSMNETDFRAKAKAEEDSEKRKKFIFMNRVKNEAIEYVEYLKSDVFQKLHTLI